MLLIAHCVRVRGLLYRGRVSYVLDGAEGLDSHPLSPNLVKLLQDPLSVAMPLSLIWALSPSGGIMIMSGRKRLAYLTRIYIIELADSRCSGLIYRGDRCWIERRPSIL
jgi:hypothetical protein